MTRPEVDDPPAFKAEIKAAIRAYNLPSVRDIAAIWGEHKQLTVKAVGPRVETYFDRTFGTTPRETALVVTGLHGLDGESISRALGE